MQNDFGSEGGSFQRAGIDISMIRAAVAPTGRVLGAARALGIKVIYLKMAFRPDLSDAGAADSPNFARHLQLLGMGRPVQAPNGHTSRILIRDTWNTDIIDELTPAREDVVVYKHRFSGFYETDLDATLKRSGIKYLIVTGCTTSICVESTIRDAMFRDYSCVLLKDLYGRTDWTCPAQKQSRRVAPHDSESARLGVDFRRRNQHSQARVGLAYVSRARRTGVSEAAHFRQRWVDAHGVRLGPPSFAHECRRRMPRRSLFLILIAPTSAWHAFAAWIVRSR